MNKKKSFLKLVSWFVLLAGGSVLTVGAAYGQQQQALIRITDKKSHEPVPFAHVCFEGLTHKSKNYSLTSLKGEVTNEVKEPSTVVISYVGYVTLIDTIIPGESLDVMLKPSILNMDEVVVTAQYAPERADKSIYRVEVINNRQIEAKAANNLGDLLKDEATMRVNQNGILGSSLKIQGLSGENIKFLVDGIPLIGRLNGNFDLSEIQLNNVDHVEVIEGPMSVIYGSNALAGVINIITKENKSSFLSTTANTYYESVGQYKFYASLNVNPGKHGFFVDGGRDFFGGYSSSGVGRVQDFKPRRQYFLDGYYTYSTGNFKGKISADYFNEKIIDKGPLLPAYYETAFDYYFNTIRYSGRGDFSLNLPRKHSLTGVASYSVYERTKRTYYNDLTTLTRTETITPDSYDTTGIYSFVGRAVYSKNNPEKVFNYQTGIDVDVEDGTGKRITDNRQEIGDYAAFLSLRIDPVKTISIQPGVRLIYNTRYNAPLVYALSTKWEVFRNANIRLSYARGFRAPDIKQLYLNFIDINHDIQGNTDLKAERSHNFNVNLNYGRENQKTAWTFDATGFFNNIENVIILASTGKGITSYQYMNLERYQTTGAHASVTFSLYPSLKLQGGWALTGIRGNSSVAGMKDFIFSDDLSGNVSYRFVKPELTFVLYYKYSGKTPNFQVDDETAGVYFVDPYHIMDFSATKGFMANKIRLSAGIKNITDTKTVPTTGVIAGAHSGNGESTDIGWGRTFFIRLSYLFNSYK